MSVGLALHLSVDEDLSALAASLGDTSTIGCRETSNKHRISDQSADRQAVTAE